MTSEELRFRIENYRLFRKALIEFNPDDVYPLATDVQDELCSELKLLQQFSNVRILGGQERHQFDPVDITGATNATPIVMEAVGHPFNDNDTVGIGEVGGNTAANGRWPKVTKVDDDHFSLNGSVGNGAYTTGGVAYHGIASAVEFRSGRKLDSPYGILTKRMPDMVEQERPNFADTVSADKVRYIYEIDEEPLILGLQGVPEGAMTIEVLQVRRPLPFEEITATVNPILPAKYNRLLFLGTIHFIVQQHEDKRVRDFAKETGDDYENEKRRWRAINVRSRMPRPRAAKRLKW